MATHLTWKGYFLAVGAEVAIYDVLIGIRYYRQDIKALLNSKSRFWDRPEKTHERLHKSIKLAYF